MIVLIYSMCACHLVTLGYKIETRENLKTLVYQNNKKIKIKIFLNDF